MIRIAKILLALAVPVRRHRTCMIGDLDELYTRRRVRYGRMRAGLWYWSEVMHTVMRYAIDRLTTASVGPLLPHANETASGDEPAPWKL